MLEIILRNIVRNTVVVLLVVAFFEIVYVTGAMSDQVDPDAHNHVTIQKWHTEKGWK